MQPVLISSDARTGTIACAATVAAPTSQTSVDHAITVVADTNSYYAATDGNTSLTIPISLSDWSNFATGAGYFVNSSSAGTYAGDAGTKSYFAFNPKYNKVLQTIQGTASLTIQSQGRTYLITADSFLSLGASANTNGNAGAFIALAHITDITNPTTPIFIETNDLLTVTFHAGATPQTPSTTGLSLSTTAAPSASPATGPEPQPPSRPS